MFGCKRRRFFFCFDTFIHPIDVQLIGLSFLVFFALIGWNKWIPGQMLMPVSCRSGAEKLRFRLLKLRCLERIGLVQKWQNRCLVFLFTENVWSQWHWLIGAEPSTPKKGAHHSHAHLETQGEKNNTRVFMFSENRRFRWSTKREITRLTNVNNLWK